MDVFGSVWTEIIEKLERLWNILNDSISGGTAKGILNGEIPSKYHSGFSGCVDLVRVEKRRLPLSKLAYAQGLSQCGDDE